MEIIYQTELVKIWEHPMSLAEKLKKTFNNYAFLLSNKPEIEGKFTIEFQIKKDKWQEIRDEKNYLKTFDNPVLAYEAACKLAKEQVKAINEVKEEKIKQLEALITEETHPLEKEELIRESLSLNTNLIFMEGDYRNFIRTRFINAVNQETEKMLAKTDLGVVKAVSKEKLAEKDIKGLEIPLEDKKVTVENILEMRKQLKQTIDNFDKKQKSEMK